MAIVTEDLNLLEESKGSNAGIVNHKSLHASNAEVSDVGNIDSHKKLVVIEI